MENFQIDSSLAQRIHELTQEGFEVESVTLTNQGKTYDDKKKKKSCLKNG